jgi:hypothetical protein
MLFTGRRHRRRLLYGAWHQQQKAPAAKALPGKQYKERQKSMRIPKSLSLAVITAAAALMFTPGTTAQAQDHPRYLDALSALRTARDYIQFDKRPDFGREKHHAVDEINKAIDEIKHAAWDDGKNTKFAPPAAGVQDPWAPLHSADEWLKNAELAIKYGHDQPANEEFRSHALAHIGDAKRQVDDIMMGH